MKKQKRWMKAVIEASKAQTPVLPFERTARAAAPLRRAVTLRKAA